MTNSPVDLGPLCGGNKEPGKITFTADLGTGLVVVRRVSATVCTHVAKNGLMTRPPGAWRKW